jgi:hypothetical protein
MLLPIPPIKVFFDNFHFRRNLQTPEIYTETVGIRSGDIKRLDAALSAEEVFGHTAVEAIFSQVIPAPQQTKLVSRHDQVQETDL